MSDDDRSSDEKASDAANAQGIAAAERKWYEQAIECFRRALELDPLSAHAYDNLATVYSELGQFRSALACYIKALEIDSENPTSHYNLACFLATHGAEMAVDEYTTALELQPDYPDAHVNLGLCLAEMGDHSGAIKAFRTASILDPDDMDALQELSATQIDVGEYAEAIRNLKHVVKKNPKNTDAWIDLGVAHTEQGFFAEAETAFRAACASDAKDALCAYHLAALYGAWERFPEALEKLANAILLDPAQVSEWAQSDRIFDPIRETPEFKKLLPKA